MYQATELKRNQFMEEIKQNFGVSPAEIQGRCARVLAACNTLIDNVVKTSVRTFETIIVPLTEVERIVATELSACNFLQFVSPIAEVREASVEVSKSINEFSLNKLSRIDLYQAVKVVSDSIESDLTVDSESRRVVKMMILEFEMNGLNLDEKQREELKIMKKRLSDLEVEFSKNMNEDTTEILFSKTQLEGCPEDMLKGLSTRQIDSSLLYVLTMKYPDYFGVMKNAKTLETRKLMERAFNTRCRENNGPIFEEAIHLRQQIAKALGYRNHAEVRLKNRMATNPAEVSSFIADLVSRLKIGAALELERMQLLKGPDEQIMTYDVGYYTRLLLESEYSLDHEKIKEYFSLEHLMLEMLNIYSNVLSIEFHEVNAASLDEKMRTKLFWHETVMLYRVNDKETSSLIGFMYVDLFPREGKYTHAACFGIQPGALLPKISLPILNLDQMDVDIQEIFRVNSLASKPTFDLNSQSEHLNNSKQSRQLPVTAMVANFSKPTADRPSLLKHDEVVTLFHELGHAMHDLCAETKYSRFHGTSVETDFVEAPSQMLENWCWDPVILKKLGKHYLTGDSLSDTVINSLVRAKNFNSGLANLRQLFFATFDMTIHTMPLDRAKEVIASGSSLFEAQNIELTKNDNFTNIKNTVDKVGKSETLKKSSINKMDTDSDDKYFEDQKTSLIDEIYERLRQEIAIVPQPPSLSPAATFGHMMGGYDAGYYGYMWSQVFSADMYYSRFKVVGLGNEKEVSQVGLDYRRMILHPGGSRPGMDSLVEFLGRKPCSDAFLKSIGLFNDGGTKASATINQGESKVSPNQNSYAS